MQAEVLRLVARIAGILDQMQVPYLVGGSLASSVYGVPRATQDADMVAALRPEHVARLVVSLGEEFYADAGSIQDAIRQHRSFNLIHLPTMYKVDVFVARPDALSLSEMARRQTLSVEAEGEVFSLGFCTPEDTILQKLDWYRAGGETSERQWQDLLGVLRIQRDTLDHAYLDLWAEEIGVSALLNRAREESNENG
jgi:hypothetical protein